MLWAPNLQLYYPFENQAKDYSGNARHGTVFGSGVYATKPNGGRCLYFDGTGDYVETPSFGLSGTVLVFAAWVRCLMHATVYQPLIGDAANSATVGYLCNFRVANSNNMTWYYADGVGNTVRATCSNYFLGFDDTWLFAAVVCDYAGKKTYFYRNGVLLSTVNMANTPVFPSTNRPKLFGKHNPPDILVNGYLQNVQLWTLATMPAAAQMLANVNRLMLSMNPIW